MNALSLLNASDSRFSSGAHRAWVTAEPADASERLGINFGDDGEWYDTEKGEMMDLMILNPGVDLNGNKVYFRVLILYGMLVILLMRDLIPQKIILVNGLSKLFIII